MGDRQDIDALLVGALYGELDGDERSRLDAHLATHPADRAALDGLRSTRALLRDSGATAALGSAEPSAAVSAKLLQEAARRAPAAPVGAGLLAFLGSFFRPVVRHPALSAAAALVLVIGVTQLVKRDGKDVELAHPEISTNSPGRIEAAPAPAPRPGTPPAGGAAAAAEGYAVDLADGEAAGEPAAGRDTAVRGNAATADRIDGLATTEGQARDGRAAQAKLDDDRGGVAATAAAGEKRGEAKDVAPARPAAPKPTGAYIAIDKGSPAADIPLKNLDEAERDDRPADTNRFAQAPAAGATATGSGSLGSMPGGGGGLETALGGAQSAPATTAPASPTTRTAAPAPAVAARAQAAPDSGAAASLKKEDAANGWAKDQHARMVKLVNAGKCNEAARIAVEISRRAYDYYQSAVVNDRAIRQCQAYVERARRAKAPVPKSRASNATPADRQEELNADSVK